MKKKKGLYLTIFIAIMVILPSTLIFNHYKVKDLDDVINYKLAHFDYLMINHDLNTDKKEHAEEFKEFLGQYQVKKMKDREWDSDVSDETGFSITIYSKGKPILASIYENRVVFYNKGNYYKVVNGPIDMDWVDKMYNEASKY